MALVLSLLVLNGSQSTAPPYCGWAGRGRGTAQPCYGWAGRRSTGPRGPAAGGSSAGRTGPRRGWCPRSPGGGAGRGRSTGPRCPRWPSCPAGAAPAWWTAPRTAGTPAPSVTAPPDDWWWPGYLIIAVAIVGRVLPGLGRVSTLHHGQAPGAGEMECGQKNLGDEKLATLSHQLILISLPWLVS